jgi:hypothetical protein
VLLLQCNGKNWKVRCVKVGKRVRLWKGWKRTVYDECPHHSQKMKCCKPSSADRACLINKRQACAAIVYLLSMFCRFLCLVGFASTITVKIVVPCLFSPSILFGVVIRMLSTV